jgi:hypothetical protein
VRDSSEILIFSPGVPRVLAVISPFSARCQARAAGGRAAAQEAARSPERRPRLARSHCCIRSGQSGRTSRIRSIRRPGLRGTRSWARTWLPGRRWGCWAGMSRSGTCRRYRHSARSGTSRHRIAGKWPAAASRCTAAGSSSCTDSARWGRSRKKSSTHREDSDRESLWRNRSRVSRGRLPRTRAGEAGS